MQLSKWDRNINVRANVSWFPQFLGQQTDGRAGPAHGHLWIAHSGASVSAPGDGFPGGAKRCWSAETGLTTSCSEQYTFTACRERGTTALPVQDLQMLSSTLPAGPKPAQQAGKALHVMRRGSVLEFVGTTHVLTHSPSFRHSLWTLTPYEWWLWRSFPEPAYVLLWLVFPICKRAAAFSQRGAERGSTKIFRGCL